MGAKETYYKRQKRPAKETYYQKQKILAKEICERDLQKRPTRDKRDLQKRPAVGGNETYYMDKRDLQETKET